MRGAEQDRLPGMRLAGSLRAAGELAIAREDGFYRLWEISLGSGTSFRNDFF